MQAFRNRVESLESMFTIPLLGSGRVTRTAGAAAGISGRVVFAAYWAGMSIKAFAKIATPRQA